MKRLVLNNDYLGRGSLILINSTHPVRYQPDEKSLLSVNMDYPDVMLERQAVNMLSEIIDTLHCRDQIIPISGYRTIQQQKSIYTDSLCENGLEFTQKYVAIPGCSEHQTGLAVDLSVNKPDIDFICPDFPYSGICQTFREQAVNYGFIERYPVGKETLTGIAHEPWHFRYVGYPHSELIVKNKQTLEEYTAYLKGFLYNDIHLEFEAGKRIFEIFYVSALQEDLIAVAVPDNTPFQVSGNNEDGFVITLWRNLI